MPILYRWAEERGHAGVSLRLGSPDAGFEEVEDLRAACTRVANELGVIVTGAVGEPGLTIYLRQLPAVGVEQVTDPVTGGRGHDGGAVRIDI